MKRFSLLIALLILIGSFIQANAIEFEVEIEPGNTFVHPDDGLTYYKANTDMYLDIKMANNDGIDWTGFTQTHKFYSTNGDGTAIIWNDGGGAAQAWDDPPGGVPSITGHNGWLDDTPNPGDDGYFGMMSAITTFSWDGSLPDTMSHATASMTGWLGTNTAMETRLRFHFSVPVLGIDPQTDIVEICIDASNHPDPIYTWFFDAPIAVDFGGPYCFKFLAEMETPPTVVAPPLLTTSHSTPFELNCVIQHDEWLPLTGVCAFDENDDPIGTATIFNENYMNWTFDPPCSWINDGLSHSVTFYAECATAGLFCLETPRRDAVLVVTEGQPEIEDYESEVLGLIGETNDVIINLNQFTLDVGIWSYEVDPTPSGTASIEDGVLSFTPNEEDDGMDYTFTVRATDCTGNYDECDVIFWARSEYMCGDPNGDLKVNILDIVFLINAKYKDGPGPGPLEISDVNNDGTVNILDIVRMINFKYKDGPILNCPVWE